MNKPRYKTGRLLVQLGNGVTWFRNQKMEAFELTSSQSEVIRFLLHHKNKPITASDLLTNLNLSQSTIAGILKRLENKGLLIRKNDSLDSRKSIITLTSKGLELENNLKSIANATEDILLKNMSDSEQAELNRLLEIALSNLVSERNTGTNA